MLKKFNILIEEVEKDVAKDFRFGKGRFFGTNISENKVNELSEKYDKIVKDDLEKALASKERINVSTLDDHGWTRNDKGIVIEKLFEENGTLYCSYFTKDYDKKLAEFEKMANTEDYKRWFRTEEAIEKDKERILSNYHIVVPISHIKTDHLKEVMDEDAKALREKEKEKYQNAINNLKFENDLQYLIDSGYIEAKTIINTLTDEREKTEEVSLNFSAFNDEKVESLFKIDKNSKDYKDYLESKKQTSEQWYYNGGTTLRLIVKLTIKAGNRYDSNRISNIEYIPIFKGKKGAGTAGEF